MFEGLWNLIAFWWLTKDPPQDEEEKDEEKEGKDGENDED